MSGLDAKSSSIFAAELTNLEVLLFVNSLEELLELLRELVEIMNWIKSESWRYIKRFLHLSMTSFMEVHY